MLVVAGEHPSRRHVQVANGEARCATAWSGCLVDAGPQRPSSAFPLTRNWAIDAQWNSRGPREYATCKKGDSVAWGMGREMAAKTMQDTERCCWLACTDASEGGLGPDSAQPSRRPISWLWSVQQWPSRDLGCLLRVPCLVARHVFVVKCTL